MNALVRARNALNERFEKMFDDEGFVLLNWGEAGKYRLFSTKPFAKPADLKTGRPWAWKDDPVFAEFVHVIGANPVRVGAPEVYGGLQTRMIEHLAFAKGEGLATGHVGQTQEHVNDFL